MRVQKFGLQVNADKITSVFLSRHHKESKYQNVKTDNKYFENKSKI